MDLLTCNPYIRLAIHSTLPAFWTINARVILDYELIFPENGPLILEYNGASYRCGAGDILFLCPGISHRFLVEEQPVSQPHIHFDLCYDQYSPFVYVCYQDLDNLDEAARTMLRINQFPQLAHSPVLQLRDPDRFRKIAMEIINSDNKHSLANKARMLQLLDTLLNDLDLIQTMPRAKPSSDMAFQIRSYLDANFQQSNSLDELAQHFSYSKFYLEKLFQRAYGCSIIQYRNQRRMDAAKQLLADHSVTATARLTGFSSIYSFSRAFQAYWGCSPSDYARTL